MAKQSSLTFYFYFHFSIYENTQIPLQNMCRPSHGRRLGAEFGEGKKFCKPNFRMAFLRKTIPFFSPRLCFVCFLPASTVSNLIYRPNMYDPYNYDHFLDQKPLFQIKNFLLEASFCQFVLYLTSNNSTSRNIGGRMHGPSLHLKFWGPSCPPKSPPVTATNYHREIQDRTDWMVQVIRDQWAQMCVTEGVLNIFLVFELFWRLFWLLEHFVCWKWRENVNKLALIAHRTSLVITEAPRDL